MGIERQGVPVWAGYGHEILVYPGVVAQWENWGCDGQQPMDGSLQNTGNLYCRREGVYIWTIRRQKELVYPGSIVRWGDGKEAENGAGSLLTRRCLLLPQATKCICTDKI